MNPFRVLASFVRARRLIRSFDDRKALEMWHDVQVRSHLKFIRAASMYYGDLFKGLDNCDWMRFPISDKQALSLSFDTLNTRGVRTQDIHSLACSAERSRDFSNRHRGLTVGLSSGTSGNRALFLSSPQENDFWLGTILARSIRIPLWKSQRIALFHRADSTLYAQLNVGPIQLRFFDLLRDFKDLLVDARIFSPTTLVGPPAVLRILADAQTGGSLQIRPRQVVSVAEVLDPLDRAAIQNAFQLRMEELYIATEGFIASTCPHGSLHLNEDMLVVQKDHVPGDPDRYVPILTDFVRGVQPIVRYRLDDVLIEEPGLCPCGSVFRRLKRIEGRCDDVLRFEPVSPIGSPISIFPDFIRAAVTTDLNIEAFRVVQTQNDMLRIELQVQPHARESAQRNVIAEVNRLFQRLGAQMPRLEFDAYRGPIGSRKLRRVERLINSKPATATAQGVCP